jgi:hypothetical protein
VSVNEDAAGPVPLRPMGLGDILDGAFKLFIANWRTMLLLAGAFLVPMQLASAFFQRDLLGQFGALGSLSTPDDVERFFASGDFGGVVLGSVLLAVGAVLVAAVAQGGIAGIAGASMLGHPVSLGQAIRLTLRRAPALIAAWILAHLLEFAPVLAGGLLLVAGGVSESVPLIVGGVVVVLAGFVAVPFLMALFVPTIPIVAIEGVGPVTAVKRAVGLVRARYWPVLGIALLSGLVALVVSGVFTSGPNVVSGFFSLDVQLIVGAAAGTVAGLVTTPFIALVATLIYMDLRVRREGLDLELQTQGIDPGTPTGL